MKQFECWFTKTIIPCTRKSEAQKLALSDNLSPHFSEEVTGLSLSFECFPPNTTHFMQPLNVAVFGPLKKQWRAILNKERESNPRSTYNWAELSRRLRELCESFNRQNILAGIKATGLVPFSVD